MELKFANPVSAYVLIIKALFENSTPPVNRPAVRGKQPCHPNQKRDPEESTEKPGEEGFVDLATDTPESLTKNGARANQHQHEPEKEWTTPALRTNRDRAPPHERAFCQIASLLRGYAARRA